MVNMKKSLLILSLILIFCISLGAVSAADNSINNISVSNVNDNDITIVNEDLSQKDFGITKLQEEQEGNFTELSSLISGADSGSTIYLTKNYKYTNGETLILVGKSLTIDGQGHTIDGSNSNYVFEVWGPNVIIKNINFINTKSNSSGGAIYWSGYSYPFKDGSNGSVINCSFVNCSAGIDGGAIYWEGVNGKVSGCSFVGCSANSGGAIHWSGGSGIVSGCSFVNCFTINGGAIYWYGNDGCVSGCSFVGCSANSGGAISWAGSSSVLSGCSFVGCSANSGGAILWSGDSGKINYNVFENNNASSGKVIFASSSLDCDFNFFGFENNASFPANLVYGVTPNNWVVLNITKSGELYMVKFVSNNGSDLTGSMLDYTARLKINKYVMDITIKNNTFNDTFVEGDYLLTSLNSGNVLVNTHFGRYLVDYEITTFGIEGENATVTVKVDESVTGNITLKVANETITKKIDNGFVTFSIVGLSPGVHNLNISYSGDENYIPFTTTDFNMTVYPNDSFTALNKLINSENTNITLDKDYKFYAEYDNSYKNGITINKANLNIDGQGHTINGSSLSSAFIINSDNVIIKNMTFINTKSSYPAGAIYWDGSGGVVINCSFVDCSAYVNGGAIYWNSGNGSVINCSFVDCSADREGGAIYWVGSSGVVSGCCFVNCSADREGGAIYWVGSSGVVSGCCFVNCSADREGGAIYWVGSSGV
ncbi:MAG: Ig-like domain-containing protein, partial [Methanobacteriaceae archaeon]|nr:Ig-like domain-containing protein [Methanobacteriaceae archaeon]